MSDTHRTNTGRELTDEDIQALADEAERGYDLDKLKPRRCKCVAALSGCRCTRPASVDGLCEVCLVRNCARLNTK